MGLTVTAPMVYFPLSTAVWLDSVGVITVAACVVSYFVALLVPAATYPSSCVVDAVISPEELTEMLGVACSAVGIASTLTLLKPSYPLSGLTSCAVVLGVTLFSCNTGSAVPF